MAGSIVKTTTASALAIAVAVGFRELVGTAIGAVIAALGEIVTLFANHLETSPSSMKVATAEEYGKLVEMSVEAAAIKRSMTHERPSR